MLIKRLLKLFINLIDDEMENLRDIRELQIS